MITSRDPATPAVTWGDSGLSIRLHRKVEVAAGGRGVIVAYLLVCGGVGSSYTLGCMEELLDRRGS